MRIDDFGENADGESGLFVGEPREETEGNVPYTVSFFI